MSLVIRDESISRALIEERRASGLDRYDEVWEGVYVMSPMANNEHQRLVTDIAAVIKTVFDWKGLGQTLAGANVSDRRESWTENYRVPDVLVLRGDSSAVDCETHWFGGPDLAIEVVSPGERVLDKLEFYARVGTNELLIIDRQPWKLTLYRRCSGTKMDQIAEFSRDNPVVFQSEVVSIRFSIDFDRQLLRLESGEGVKLLEITISS
jgi:Uma2 family endonuclease